MRAKDMLKYETILWMIIMTSMFQAWNNSLKISFLEKILQNIEFNANSSSLESIVQILTVEELNHINLASTFCLGQK